MDNLTRSFSDEWSLREIEDTARGVFKNLALMLFEIGWSFRISPEKFQKCVSVDGRENYLAAVRKKRGILILTAHLGSWELLPMVRQLYEQPVVILYRPIDFEPLDRFFCFLRSRRGAQLLPKKRSMRRILTHLRDQKTIAILLDQNADWYNGVFVDFFGRRACTDKGLALLALKTRAPVLPVFLVRHPPGFKVLIGREIPPAQTGDKTKDVETNTERYNQAIEKIVRQYPDQWFWVHQRWKTKPYKPWPRFEQRAGRSMKRLSKGS